MNRDIIIVIYCRILQKNSVGYQYKFQFDLNSTACYPYCVAGFENIFLYNCTCMYPTLGTRLSQVHGFCKEDTDIS